jgi:8-oxo-dGTP pyrophosphatase MutT (NUDIX family)
MSDKRYVINVQGAIYHEDKFLLTKRSQAEDFMPGIFDLPGGTIEAEDEADDDVILATLTREIREEVNVEVENFQLVITRYFEADDDPVINLVFLCRYISGEAQAIDPDEVEAVYWMTAEEAIQHANCLEWTQLYLKKSDALRKKIQLKA